MIRFDQRNFDVQETERVFKKVIHPTHVNNSIRLVDKDGIPLRLPNSAALSRQRSSYVLTPRGVPARKSSHSYSGQIAKDKMHNLVNNMDTSSQEMASFTSVHNYGLSSAGSSHNYAPASLPSKKRTFGSGPPRSYKSPMAQSASTERSRHLTVTPDENVLHDPDREKWNGSPQGKRLEKEWVALSQCRALKRSSEILSHRVDRMYFMTGNKLKLQQKYHIEDDELQHLKELSQARASSRTSRWSSRAKKGDIYRPDRSMDNSKTSRTVGEEDSQSELTNGVLHEGSGKIDSAGRNERTKENTDPTSNMIVSQKPLTPKPSSRRSPLQGWAGEDQGKRQPTEADLLNNHQDSLHEDNVDGLEAQNVTEVVNEKSKDITDISQTNDVVGNNVIEENNEEVTVEDHEIAEKERKNNDNEEERTENPVFVTEGGEADDHSVQNNENSEKISKEGNIKDNEVNEEVVPPDNVAGDQ